MFRFTEQQHQIGLAILRIVAGVVFFMHGWQKIQMGHDGVTGFFGGMGIPAPSLMAWLVTLLETGGAILLILGALTRLVTPLFAIDMLTALFTVHISKGFFATSGGYELVLLLAGVAVTLAIAGPGAPSVDAVLARRKAP
jgi:putative oxidoreductase